MEICIRKIGNSKGAVIPAPLLKELGLDVGNIAQANVHDGRLIIEKQIEPEYSLERLLSQCNEENMVLNEEDKVWLHESPVGNEVL
ncbi:MAG: antitoxin component of MazEF toxin-antitoxin module [Glaciecola sp.]|jgi:antitoxin component of MazEF toxin-antitoxin module